MEIFSTSFSQSLGIGSTGAVFVISIISMILSILGAVALTNSVSNSYLARPLGIIESYRKTGRPLLSAIGAYILAGLLIIAISIWWLVPIIGWLTGFGILLFFSIVAIPFIVPAIVIEKQSATNVIQRAWDLSRRRFWWLVGFMLLLGIFGQIIVTVPAFLFAGLVQAFIASSVDAATLRIVQQIIGLLLNLIYIPLQLTCVILLYFDTRVRTEGLDLALETIDPEADNVIKEVQTTLESSPTQYAGAWPTWREFGYFALFSVAAGVVCGVVYAVFFAIALALFTSGFGSF